MAEKCEHDKLQVRLFCPDCGEEFEKREVSRAEIEAQAIELPDREAMSWSMPMWRLRSTSPLRSTCSLITRRRSPAPSSSRLSSRRCSKSSELDASPSSS